MYSTVNKNQKGFTLIEIAISMVVLGIIAVVAIYYYNQYKKEQAIEQTDRAITKTLNALGGFRSVYGRYPCPAPYDAVAGDADYGREDCTISAVGTCTNGVCTDISSRTVGTLPSPHYVLRGTIPFRSMNIQEDDIYDGYGQRLTYAVTQVLTDSSTYNRAQGGISIIDENGDNVVEPAGAAHFVIVSHGENQTGGYNRAGTQTGGCPAAADPEGENCDADATYRAALKNNNFDDKLRYFSSIEPQEWQRASTNQQNIHLRTGSMIAIGADASTNLTSAEEVEIFGANPDEGILEADGGLVTSSQICEYDGTGTAADCFPSRLIAGQIASGEGMSCPAGEFMTGIQNGAPVCVAEVYVSCPEGNFISGINADGSIKCDVSPPPGCFSTTVTNSCGTTSTLNATYSGGYELAYSGECYRIATNYDAAYFATQIAAVYDSNLATFLNNVNGIIDSINAEARVMESCGSTAATAQIRDAYECVSGEFFHRRAHERSGYTTSSDPFPTNVVTNSSPWPAEIVVPYSIGADPNNNQPNHDCWCREDYRMVTNACPSGFAGNRITIQKHNCPQTAHNWTTIYTDTSSCECVPGITTTTQSCASYYGLPASAVTGNVVFSYNVSCPDAVVAAVPFDTDTSACACPVNSININRTSCPVGTTNSFSWTDPEGATHNETAVQSITTQTWSCGAIPPGGSYGPAIPVDDIPACVCDENLVDYEWKPCPDPTTSGPGLKYEKEWNCETNSWEPESDWELVENKCYSCLVEAPAGTPTPNDFALGDTVGSACNCSTPAIALCNISSGTGYNVWNNCSCVLQSP